MLRKLACLAAVLALAACAAVKTAETPEQKAFAAYASFVIAEEAAAEIVTNPSTPPSVVTAIKLADAIAKPAADAMRDAARTYAAVRKEIDAIREAGGTPAGETLLIAQVSLEALLKATLEAEPKIKELRSAVDAVRKK